MPRGKKGKKSGTKQSVIVPDNEKVTNNMTMKCKTVPKADGSRAPTNTPKNKRKSKGAILNAMTVTSNIDVNPINNYAVLTSGITKEEEFKVPIPPPPSKSASASPSQIIWQPPPTSSPPTQSDPQPPPTSASPSQIILQPPPTSASPSQIILQPPPTSSPPTQSEPLPPQASSLPTQSEPQLQPQSQQLTLSTPTIKSSKETIGVDDNNRLTKEVEKDDKMNNDKKEEKGKDNEASGDFIEPQIKENLQSVTNNSSKSMIITIEVPDGHYFNLDIYDFTKVQEIYDKIMHHQVTCHRTCFYLVLNDRRIEPAESIRNLIELKAGAIVCLIEDSYTMSKVRLHILHVRQLLKSLDYTDAYNGVEGSSLSMLQTITQGDIWDIDNNTGRRMIDGDAIDCTPMYYVKPGVKNPPLTPLHPNTQYSQCPQMVRVLIASSWNPPMGPQKLQGDVMYLYVLTMEGKQLHITANQKGFFINKSTHEVFNPKAENPHFFNHSFIEVMSKASNAFRRGYQLILRQHAKSQQFERIPTSLQQHQWTAPAMDHSLSALRTNVCYATNMTGDDCMYGDSRDWNQELQVARELPRETINERIKRLAAIYKVQCDFVAVAIRGALGIIDGNVIALNPGENPKMQMYIWNSVFFSLGFDVRDHYKDLGGDYAAFIAPRHDMAGVRLYSSSDIPGLFTLGTVVVDYRGVRVTAQSIIPGTLEHDHEQEVVYGSQGMGKDVLTHPKYLELLNAANRDSNIAPHWVRNSDGEIIKVCSSIECNGIIGTDHRLYILDLLRNFPPDVNFIPLPNIELSADLKKMGFPITHRHILSCLRVELLSSYTKDMRWKSIFGNSKSHFDGFNPDVFLPNAILVDMPEAVFTIAEQERLAQDAAEYLVLVQIPRLINEHVTYKASPFDGKALTDSMHKYGINTRYLGIVTKELENKPHMGYLYRLGVMELIVRTTKHLYYRYMQNSFQRKVATRVCHFLNCFFSTAPVKAPEDDDDYDLVGKQNKRKGRNKANKRALQAKESNNVRDIEHNDTKNLIIESKLMTNTYLWQLIKIEANHYWNFDLGCESIAEAVTKYDLQHISILRSFCQRVGIQILLREYKFDYLQKMVFNEDDILNIIPLVKEIRTEIPDAVRFYNVGQDQIKIGHFKSAYKNITKSYKIYNFVYGDFHIESIRCLHLQAHLSYVLGKDREALSVQQRATIFSERVNGIDHPSTIDEYLSLAIYAFSNHKLGMALQLYYRSRYLISLLCSEDHPKVALIDLNIGIILHSLSQHIFANYFLDSARDLTVKYFGNSSPRTAISLHFLARNLICLNDFRSALLNERESHAIYKQLYGEDHPISCDSEYCLRQMTRQLVIIQRYAGTISGFDSNAMVFKGLPWNVTPLQRGIIIPILNNLNEVLFPEISNKLYRYERIPLKRRVDSIYDPNDFMEVKNASGQKAQIN